MKAIQRMQLIEMAKKGFYIHQDTSSTFYISQEDKGRVADGYTNETEAISDAFKLMRGESIQSVSEVETVETEKENKMKFKVFYTANHHSIEETLANPETKFVEIEADDVATAKKMVVREAKKAGIVDSNDTFKSEWLNYTSKNRWLRPLNLGARGFSGGLCLHRVVEIEVVETEVVETETVEAKAETPNSKVVERLLESYNKMSASNPSRGFTEKRLAKLGVQV